MKHIIISLTLGLVLTLTLLVLLPSSVLAGHVFGVHAAADGVIFVDWDAVGDGTGENWIDAYTSLQAALDVADATDQIWVAAGVYTPTDGLTRTATFRLIDGVAIYGGFEGGNQDEGMNDRNWKDNITILSGDLDGNDTTEGDVVTVTTAITGSNAYHVVTAIDVTTATLDGFTITAGNADGRVFNDNGGGMYSIGSNPMLRNITFSGNYGSYGGGMYNDNSNPTLRAVIFRGNRAYYSGGGVLSIQSDVVLTDVVFSNNQVRYDGGGMYNDHASITLTHVTFDGNRAGYGGGMFNENSSFTLLLHVLFSSNFSSLSGGGILNVQSDSMLTDVTFTGNRSMGGGGGGLRSDDSSLTLAGVAFNSNQAYHGGGVYIAERSPTLINVSFRGNQAHLGGGMYSRESSFALTNVLFSGNYANDNGGGMYNQGDSYPKLTNVTFSGNYAEVGGGMYNSSSNPNLMNCILWGNDAYTETEIYNTEFSMPSVTHSDIQGGGYIGLGNINTNPMFIAPVTATLAPTITGDYRLGVFSLAIDAGNNHAPGLFDITTDLDGEPRFVDVPTAIDTGYGDAPIVDMGTYEFQITALAHTLSVVLDGSGYGRVESVPAGIACPDNCVWEFESGRVVTLTATALDSSIFAGWSGACSDTVPTCSFILDADRSVTAIFDLEPGFRLYLPLAMR